MYVYWIHNQARLQNIIYVNSEQYHFVCTTRRKMFDIRLLQNKMF